MSGPLLKTKFSTNADKIVGMYWRGTPGADLPPTRGRVHVAEVPGLTNAAITAALASVAKDMETYAKQNHPWQNRSGDAEKGLTGYWGGYGQPSEPGKVMHYAAVRHGFDVPYGVWLEVRWGGKFGIIQRTLEVFKGEVTRRIEAALNEVLGG